MRKAVVKNTILPGQIFMWDILAAQAQEQQKENIAAKTENKSKSLQQMIIDRYSNIQHLNRLIKYVGNSGYGVELLEDTKFKTIHVNSEGKEEFSSEKESRLLPQNKILINKNKITGTTQIQTDRLHKLLTTKRNKVNRVVKRHGDFNLLVEMTDKIISILPNGWMLDFMDIKQIDCSDDEIFLVPARVEKAEIKEENLGDIQKNVKVGDIVEAQVGNKITTGKIVHEYGIGNQILNIEYDNYKKHTAIGRIHVRKILQSA